MIFTAKPFCQIKVYSLICGLYLLFMENPSTSLQSLIDNFYDQVPQISSEKKYWLIRTNSGEYYDTFLANNYVAIGYNEISLQAVNELKNASPDHTDVVRNVKNLVIETYKENEKRPGLVANQILNFTYNIKKGDVVIIPSSSSNFVSFGEVEETPLMSLDYNRKDECDYYRRKKIKWIKQLRRNELEPLLFRMFFSHNAVNDVSIYGDLIESTFSNYFIKDEQEHIVLNIQQNENIGALDLFQLGFYLLNSVGDFIKANELNTLNVGEFDVKVNLNSKGKLKFISKFGKGGMILAIIAVAINGGGGEIGVANYFSLNLSTNGIIQKVIDYQNESHNREMTEKIINSMDSLMVETPDDVVQLLKEFSNKTKPK